MSVHVSQVQACNLRIIVDVDAATLTVMRCSKVITTFSYISLGRSGKTDSTRLGYNNTPLGTFRIGWINRDSRYHVFLGLTYPDQPAANRALREGRISKAQWQHIYHALATGEIPPQYTPLGGNIGIHGLGKGDILIHRQYNWTNGCVALTNTQINRLLQWAQIGTSVEIR